MGMMAKMRGLAPWFILTVGGLFVLFMILSDSKVTQIVGARSNAVGSINGVEITYQTFSNYLENARKNYADQTGTEVKEDQMEFLRDQVWNQIVSQNLVQDKIKEFGIVVSDDEVRNVILGDNPPAFITQSFVDSTGQINRDAYLSAIYDPSNQEAMVYYENLIRQQLITEKLQKMLLTTINISDDEIVQKFIDDNIKMTAEYVFVNSLSIPDSLIDVSDADMKEYYDENKDSFISKEQSKIKYILFRKEASEQDTIEIRNDLVSIVNKLEKDTSTFKTYVDIYSDLPYQRDTLAFNRIPVSVTDQILSAKNNKILEPTITPEGYAVYRVLGKMRNKETFVRASHILIKTDKNNDAEAKQKIDEIYNRLIAGEDFTKLASELSEDVGSAKRGGDLGWFGRGQMVPVFERAAFNGKLNQIQKPVKSNFGYHIVKATGKNNYKYILEKILRKLEPSPSTLDDIYNNANDFSYLADKNGFDVEANLAKYDVVESSSIQESFTVIPGLGSNRALVKFSFENSIGAVSPAFKVSSGYVVAQIIEKTDEHVQDFESVKNRIRPILVREKKLEKSKETAYKVRELINRTGNLFDARQIDPSAKINSVPEFTTGKEIPGLGNEYAFSEYCLHADLNKLSEPVLGEGGSYLIRVLSRAKFDSTSYSLQKINIRNNLIMQAQNSFFQEWTAKLQDEADIVDNRHLFYK